MSGQRFVKSEPTQWLVTSLLILLGGIIAIISMAVSLNLGTPKVITVETPGPVRTVAVTVTATPPPFQPSPSNKPK